MENQIIALIIGVILVIVGIILKILEKFIYKKWDIDTPLDELGEDIEEKGKELINFGRDEFVEEVIIPNKELVVKRGRGRPGKETENE